ncbi:ImmA/IrrE family metallo-endopeptidase [uncultured Anaerofustis sp.]|uniref:ImmA/IrrE family metallo-endopeptidase n=1 Tax=uncultured Anaerofustis sp. TaxID=904996 RepID=UPI0025CDA86A|nr:ImmA/IrrE family metallo-endopeptidase [uncultured Anaerofustis sp.]
MNEAREQFIINTAIRTVLRSNVKTLPVNMHEVCKSLNIKTRKFSESKAFTDKIRRNENNNAFTFPGVNNILYIFYNDEMIPYEKVRSSIAHEIGHIVLKHLSILDYEKNNELEEEAELCGRYILIPNIILDKCKKFNPKDIMVLCETTWDLAKEFYNQSEVDIENKEYIKLKEFLLKQFEYFIDFYK